MRKQNIDFRADETAYVMRRWQSIASCSLVGVSGVGKSNLLHHLADPAVVEHYLNWNQHEFRAVMVDTNMLVTMRSDELDVSAQFRTWAGYELIMHRLYMAFYDSDLLDDEELKDFFRSYNLLQDARNPIFDYMGLRHLERGLDIVLRTGIKLVIMFDEAEQLFNQLPVKFFLSLRGLRDRYKSQLAYLTFSRWTLAQTAQACNVELRQIESFTELFNDHTYFVGPYSPQDATVMVQHMISQNNLSGFPQHLSEYLMYVTGSFPGLMRAGFRALQRLGANISAADTYQPDAQRRILRMLLEIEGLRAECEAIWHSLTQDEQQCILAFAHNTQRSTNDGMKIAISDLLRKQILLHDRDEARIIVMPPIFRAYAMRFVAKS